MTRARNSAMSPPLKVALVHDWLVAQRGGENVLLELAHLFPEAPIFTLVHRRGAVHPELEVHEIRTSFIQSLPGAPQSFRRYLPLFPRAIETFDLSAYDLVVSTSHCVAKGVQLGAGQRHISYIHTPMRYLYDQLPEYLPQVPGRRWLTPLAQLLTTPLRRWDQQSAQRPTLLVANSNYVKARIARVWEREAKVLYPPVAVGFFRAAPKRRRAGFLVVSALVPYKRVDLAVQACTELGLPLTVCGDGAELPRLKAMAGPTVTFVGPKSPEGLRELYAQARALLFCGVEDFGIVPVEAMAAGCPVIALGEGGALETVGEGGPKTGGVLFRERTVEALVDAIARFEVAEKAGEFTRTILAARAREFSPQHFRTGFMRLVDTHTKA